MIDISHILVLSQKDFVQRQVRSALGSRFGFLRPGK